MAIENSIYTPRTLKKIVERMPPVCPSRKNRHKRS